MSIISMYGDGGDDLPKGDRRVVADFANMLADSALFYGKDSVRELIVLFARHVVDYPHELSEPLKRLTNGLGEIEKRANEPRQTHNHFDKGSINQVFNGSVSGDFENKE